MVIPFSLPLIDDDVIAEVNDALLNTGWLTTGPKVRQLETELAVLTGTPVLCVNSWSSGAMLMLRWFGVGPGDEVIIPAYTYSATALCALNLGATVVMVDVSDDFTLDPALLRAAITPRTKAVIPVDMGGWPADYDAIHAVLAADDVKALFTPGTQRQRDLGRILVVADAAHSIGSTYRGLPNGRITDAAVFSMHSVKNLTTGEGGAVCINLPAPFDNEREYTVMKALALNGQSKSAYEKNVPGAWRYDIVEQGLKINLPDINAAIGLAQVRKYASQLLPDRRRKFDLYQQGFSQYDWAILPPYRDESRESSAHLYLLRIAGADEARRDAVITAVSEQGIGVNVHYIPMPMLTLFRDLGYDIADYPKTFELYENEITLPLYNTLTEEQIAEVIFAVASAVEATAGIGAVSS